MTKRGRRQIYEIVLWCIGDDNNEGVCHLLSAIDYEFDFWEFYRQIPAHKNPAGYWWEFTPEGNRKRRIALLKAIQLTYA